MSREAAIDSSEIKPTIKQVIFETTNVKPEEIDDDASFVEDLEFDSLTLLEIAVNIDQTFDLDMPEDDMSKFRTVNESTALVKAMLLAKSGQEVQ